MRLQEMEMTILEKILYLLTETIFICIGCYIFVEGIKSIIQKIDIYLQVKKIRQKIEEEYVREQMESIYKIEPKEEENEH